MKEKIGVGIITYNRPDFLKKCYNSLPSYIDNVVVVNDGDSIDLAIKSNTTLKHSNHQNVGKAKNIAMQYLLDCGNDYIFTIEDDIEITDPNVIYNYIEAYKATGIQHFNFGFSQRENLDNNLNPVYRKIIDYGQ